MELLSIKWLVPEDANKQNKSKKGRKQHGLDGFQP